ncbi:hypothetical protein QVD17_01900 [Tagetes erecta]|uniref:Uncharacterized protein n=1 Tax=Tagetes erecta TaxID=13708 RepID=A0AAD8L5N5_TARER|nr:hypothetical protein QVD17_01900 [Tagetes erecta]
MCFATSTPHLATPSLINRHFYRSLQISNVRNCTTATSIVGAEAATSFSFSSLYIRLSIVIINVKNNKKKKILELYFDFFESTLTMENQRSTFLSSEGEMDILILM